MLRKEHKEKVKEMEQTVAKQRIAFNLVQKQRDTLRKAVDNNVKKINDAKNAYDAITKKYRSMVYLRECTITDLKQIHAQSMKDSKAKLIQMHQEKNEMRDVIDRLKTEHETEQKKMKKKLKRQRKSLAELEKKVDLYEGKPEMINTMTLSELNELKRALQDTINDIETAKEKKEECVICKDNPCNIAFIGCGHCIICEECERNQISKICPQCQNPYSQVVKIAK